MNRLLAAIPVIGLLGLAAMLGVGLTQDPQKLPSTLIGQTVPPFDLPPIAPDIPALTHTAFQGQVSLLNVFGSWCTSCLVEHPVLLALARRGAVPIYGLDWKDEPGAGAAWLARHGNPYTAVGDDASGIRLDGEQYLQLPIPVGESREVAFELDHRGPTGSIRRLAPISIIFLVLLAIG